MERFTIIRKKNDNVEVIEQRFDIEFTKNDKNDKYKRLVAANIRFTEGEYVHACWDCSNGYCDKCQKVADERKRKIDEYKFIKEGLQVYFGGKKSAIEGESSSDDMLKFIVTDCENFESSKTKKKTK